MALPGGGCGSGFFACVDTATLACSDENAAACNDAGVASDSASLCDNASERQLTFSHEGGLALENWFVLAVHAKAAFKRIQAGCCLATLLGPIACGHVSSSEPAGPDATVDAGGGSAGTSGQDASFPTDAGAAGTTAATNECGGTRDLRFGGHAAHLADKCGECNDGTIVCGSPNGLVCNGAKNAKPDCGAAPDGRVANACGGFVSLEYQGHAALPGAACGACGSGVLACVDSATLDCTSENAAACKDAGEPSDASDAGEDASEADDAASDAGEDASEGDDPLDAGERPDGADPNTSLPSNLPDGGDWPGSAGCPADGHTWDGQPVHVGDPCGPCSDGYIACGYFFPLCVAATPAGYCQHPNAGLNDCGGKGVLKFHGVPTSPGALCGACNHSVLECASPTSLACTNYPFDGPQVSCDHPSALDTCTVPLAAYSATPMHVPPAPAAETKPLSSSYADLGLPANALQYNGFNQRLYASLPASFGLNGNSVAVIEPTAKVVEKYISVGKDPSLLALSDDGQVLWVFSSGEKSLRRVDLANGAVGPALAVSDVDGPTTSIAVLPGTHDSVLVASGITLVYDNGVTRANATNSFSKWVTVSNSAQLAYGYSGTSALLAELCINENGVFRQQRIAQASTFGGENISFETGFVNHPGGIFDINKRTVVTQFTPEGVVSVPDPVNHRLFVLQTDYAYRVTFIDLDSFANLGSEPLPGYGATHPAFARWGRYGFAIVSKTDSMPRTLFVGRSSFIP